MTARPLFVVAALALLAPAPTLAQDLGARVTPSGLGTLTGVALERIPSVYSIERLDPVLFDCPGDDIVAHVPPTDVNLRFRDLDVRTDDGAIVLTAVIDVDVANTIQIDNPNACFGTALCDVSANLDRLGITVELAASTGPDGGVVFQGAAVDLALSSEDLALESEGCAVGDAATWLFDAFEDWALEQLTPRLEALVSERLATALTDLFAETVGLSLEFEGFAIEAALESLDLTRVLGVTLSGDAAITWSGAALYEEPAPDVEAPEGAALPDDLLGDFQFAVSDRLVTESLYEAWRGGLIRRLLADQSLSVDLAGDGVASLIGLTGGARIDLGFDIERPLVATFGRAAPDVAEIQLEGLHVTIEVTPASGQASTIHIYADGRAGAALTMNPAAGGLVLDLDTLTLDSVRIESDGEDLELSGARLESLVTNTALPMLAGRLTGLPIAPGLQPIMGTFVNVRAVESEGGWQRVGADLVVPNPDDVIPPESSFVSPETLLAAGTAAFAVTGSDDDTPEGLLRYRAWLDGNPLAEGEASSLSTLRFDVTAGEHTVEVAAVDLNDNRDPTPAVHSFTVDGTPPEITLTDAPASILTGPDVTATWTASDLEGGVMSRWVIREIGEDGMATVVQEAPFAPGGGSLAVGADSLTPGSLFELEVIARDDAGNLASVAMGFATPSSGGCGVTPLGARPVPGFALAFFALVLLRRRARR